MINIRYATLNDLELLKNNDKHISEKELENIINLRRVYVLFENGKFIAWLRYNLFWDNTPFMNMLYVLESNRGKGYGKVIINEWEKDMKNKGYDYVLTSTQSNERGQFFYRKNGYEDIGNMILPNEMSEIILYKKL